MKSKDRYLRSVRRLLYVRGKWEKRFLENLKKDMEEYERTHPGAVYEELTEEFGTPIDTFFSYLSEQDSAYLTRRIRRKKMFRKIGSILTAFLIAGLLLYCRYLAEEYDRIQTKAIAGSYELIIDDGNVTDQEIREVIRRVEEQQKIYERDEESAVQER